MSLTGPDNGDLDTRNLHQHEDDRSSLNPSPPLSLIYDRSASLRVMADPTTSTTHHVQEAPSSSPLTGQPLEAPALIPSYESLATSSLATSFETIPRHAVSDEDDEYAVYSGSSTAGHHSDDGFSHHSRLPSIQVISGAQRSSNSNHQNSRRTPRTTGFSTACTIPPVLSSSLKNQIPPSVPRPVTPPPATLTLSNQFRHPAPLGDPSLAKLHRNPFEFPPASRKQYPPGGEKLFQPAPPQVRDGIDLIPALDQYNQETKILTDIMQGQRERRDQSREEALDARWALDNLKHDIEQRRRLERACKREKTRPPPLTRPLPDAATLQRFESDVEGKERVAAADQSRLEETIVVAAAVDQGRPEGAMAKPFTQSSKSSSTPASNLLPPIRKHRSRPRGSNSNQVP